MVLVQSIMGREFIRDASMCLHIGGNSWPFEGQTVKYKFIKPYIKRVGTFNKDLHSPVPVKDLPQRYKEEVNQIYVEDEKRS